jgi:uncharacterized cupin superfamily protein
MHFYPFHKGGMETMKYTHIYTGSDGLSHFEDVDMPMTSGTSGSQASELMKATGVSFRTTGADFDLSWHNAPRRQFVVWLEGTSEIVASDGTTRRFGPGDILLAEDTTGKGHISRALNNQRGKSLSIPLD